MVKLPSIEVEFLLLKLIINGFNSVYVFLKVKPIYKLDLICK